MVHEILGLIRREQHVREVLRAASNSGFGHNFEREFSTPQPGLGNNISRHRVEVDACCDNESNVQGSDEAGLDVPLLRDDDISASFKPLSHSIQLPTKLAHQAHSRLISEFDGSCLI